MAEKPADKPSETPKTAKPAKQALDLNALSGLDFVLTGRTKTPSPVARRITILPTVAKSVRDAEEAVAARAVRYAIVD